MFRESVGIKNSDRYIMKEYNEEMEEKNLRASKSTHTNTGFLKAREERG